MIKLLKWDDPDRTGKTLVAHVAVVLVAVLEVLQPGVGVVVCMALTGPIPAFLKLVCYIGEQQGLFFPEGQSEIVMPIN